MVRLSILWIDKCEILISKLAIWCDGVRYEEKSRKRKIGRKKRKREKRERGVGRVDEREKVKVKKGEEGGKEGREA